MDLIISHTLGLLVVAIVVAIVARRVHLPYTVGLVAAGACLALAHAGVQIPLTEELIFDVILPPLLFEAALCIRWSELAADSLPVVVLATVGVVVSACVVAAGLVFLLGVPVVPALTFGVLIAATDPVAVIAMFKDTGIGGRVRLLVESESLLNDGVAAVIFALVVAWAKAGGGAPPGMTHMAAALSWSAGGGIVIGLACGGLAILLAGRTADHLVEAALTVVAAYGSFLVAEHAQASGVLATVSAGLLMGNVGVLRHHDSAALSEHGRDFIVEFWEFAAFIANSIVFLLIGLTAAQVARQVASPLTLAAVIGLVLLGRALTVYPLCLVFIRSRWAVLLRQQHVLWWGGLRGALALALALALPADYPDRDRIVIAAFGVVGFSVLIQGLTMPALLRLLGFVPGRPGSESQRQSPQNHSG
jgi:CPA1 family monovalent cation:H+ antiporter